MKTRGAGLAAAALAGAALFVAAGFSAASRPEKPAGARSLPVVLREARDFARAGDPRARDRYLDAIRQNPSDASVRAELADYLWGTGNPTEAEAQMDWLVARGHPRPGFLRYYGLRLFEAGNFVKASRVLESASREGSPDYDLLFCLGTARLEKGDFPGSEQALRSAIRTSPGQASAHHILGDLLKLTARPREAVAELRLAAGEDESSADTWLDLAQALAANGERPDAEEACRRSIRLQPDRAAAHLTLGRILRAEGNAEESASELAASRSLYDREEEQAEKNRGAAARTSQGWVLLRMNRPADALAQFKSIPESSASGWRGRAEALERLGRREEAIGALERAKTLSPDDHSLDYALARLRASVPGRP